jgi:hypothetical protein
VNVADDPTLDEVNGRSFPHDGRPDLDYILVNPNSPYPNDAIEQHELAHLEAYHDGTRDEEVQELIATERGHDYAMQRYRETNDPKYFDYAEFQRNKHNTIKLPGVDSQGNFSLHQLFDDAVNKVTGNGSGTDFIR